MSLYTPNDNFTDSEIYDLSDLVKGGSDGDANVPIEALYDQTNYLKNRLGRFEDIRVLTASVLWDVSMLRKLLVFSIDRNCFFTLPDPGDLSPGTPIYITTIIPVIKSLSILSPKPIIWGSQSMVSYLDNTQAAVYMHDGESLCLVAGPDRWYMVQPDGHFGTAGEGLSGWKQLKNTLIGNGTIYQRADIPRVALFVVNAGPAAVSDATWLSDPDGKPVYRGCWSIGNGTTTLRLPDERGMSERFLDLGRGLDTSRIYNNAGGFEEEMVAPHDHFQRGQKAVNFGGTIPALYRDTDGITINTSFSTALNNGTQNIVKNIGKIPLIRY